MDQRSWARVHSSQFLQLVQVFGWHVLMVEGDHSTPSNDLSQGVQVTVVADLMITDDLNCTNAWRLRK